MHPRTGDVKKSYKSIEEGISIRIEEYTRTKQAFASSELSMYLRPILDLLPLLSSQWIMRLAERQ